MKSKKLFWTITSHCNLKCRYCFYNTGLEKKVIGKINLQKANKIIKKLPAFFNEVVFTGGEPLLEPNIFILIEKCKNQKLKTHIITNGLLLNKTNCQKLSKLKVDYVSISLDSLSPKTNNFLRGKTNLALKGVKNLLQTKRKDMIIQILQTITPKNLSSIKPMIKFCQKNNLKLWLSPLQINLNNKKTKSLNLKKVSPKKLEKQISIWSKDKNQKFKNYTQNCLRLIKGKKPIKISCPMGNDHFVLDTNGNIYPCFLKKDILLGNIY